MADQNDNIVSVDDGCSKNEIVSYFENIFRSAVDDERHESDAVNNTTSADRGSDADSASSDDEDASHWSESDHSESADDSDSSVESLPQTKKRKIAQVNEQNPSVNPNPPAGLQKQTTNVVVPIFACENDSSEAMFRKEQEYVHACVRMHEQRFGKSNRVALWRQLAVELGLSYVDVVKIGDTFSGTDCLDKSTPTPLKPPRFFAADDDRVVQCVAKYAGGGIDIWDTLASTFNCTALDVKQRWSKVVPVPQQRELVRVALQRRIYRLGPTASASSTGRLAVGDDISDNYWSDSSGDSDSDSDSESDSGSVSSADASPSVVKQKTAPATTSKSTSQVVMPITARYNANTMELISQQVYLYNNSSCKLTPRRFWRALATHLDANKYLVLGISSSIRSKRNWYLLLERHWNQLCTTNTRITTATRPFVLCQPRSTSDMNAVVYFASVGVLSHFVRVWWQRHLYHNVFDVYNACSTYIDTKPTEVVYAADSVERVMLTMLFAVALSVKADTELDRVRTRADNNALLPPVIFNHNKVTITIPKLPLPLSQQQSKYDAIITRTASMIQALPPNLAAVRWKRLAETCRTSVRCVHLRWRWLKGRDTSDGIQCATAADTTSANDYVLVVPQSVGDNYW